MLTTHHHHHHHHHNPRRASTSPAVIGTITSCTTTNTTINASASSPGSAPRSLPTPRTSSERGTTKSSSSEVPRISFTDEAQACYNLLLLIRNDTQALITLRNDNLAELEGRKSNEAPNHASAGGEGENEDEGDAGSDTDRSLLLAAVNEAITFATRTIAELGPFLERHRWPAGASTQPQHQRSSLAAIVKPPKILLLRRRRTSSLSSSSSTSSSAATTSGPSTRPPAAAAAAAADGDGHGGPPTAEVLFSWTLALTELHSAVLTATARLKGFLEFGAEAVGVSEENRRRREGRASWWAQGRGEFENVELIQSLLGRPRRKWEADTGTAAVQTEDGDDDTTKAAALLRSGMKDGEPPGDEEGWQKKEKEEKKGEEDDNVPAVVLTPVLEVDDTQSEAWASEPMTSAPSTIKSTRGDLTARPRHYHHRRENSLQQDSPFAVRRSVTEPLSPSSPVRGSPGGGEGGGERRELHMARSETFGQAASKAKGHLPRLPSISTTQPSSLNAIQRRLTQALAGAYQGHQRSPTGSTPRTASSPAALLGQPLFPDPGQGQQEQAQLRMRPASLFGLEVPPPDTPYTPETPRDPHLEALINLGGLPSKTFQPVIEALDHMIEVPVVSPVSPPESPQKQGGVMAAAAAAALSVPPLLRSPQVRKSIHPVIEGGDVPSSLPAGGQQQHASFVSPVESQEPQTAVTVSPTGSQHPRLSMPLPPLPSAPPSENRDGDRGGGKGGGREEGDEHWPFLVYMARKRAVAASRWSLRSSQAGGEGGEHESEG
ncbi:hypothetical protein M406DRAFT_350800 [Cryphonectria parasitica EP155]|uniref:Uncharacterized protein n=1 Tax=Cryphonectria parasitica (strain ATCC 38755 / EP155) TaxID=660469 RepID=A0A9P4Y710_CRYP1|nr:uncharacterized protein M406DRAFT_350800 [Cryphonectria parasitica EP155]KAF3767896.1 hypothetical protein M406DRAFT_350800 [Cryphonectria parasitica EP155]